MRLPIRARLTAWYALLLATIIAALGAFLVLRLRTELHARVDREVRTAETQIAKGYASEGGEEFHDVSATVLPGRRSAAQVLDPRGRVLLSAGDAVAARPMLRAATHAGSLTGGPRLFTLSLGRPRGRFRAIASWVTRLGRRHTVVVAESLQDVDAAVRRAFVLLLLGGPAALAATAVGGWLLARKALLPVDRITSEAEQIGIDRLHERVAVPRAADEIRHLATTLNAMLDRLESGVEGKRQLVADASHELRTPLAVMRTELDVSLRSDELSPGARTVLTSVREEVDRMTRTVEDLLLLAALDEGRLELLPTRLNLLEALEAAARPLRALAAAKRLRLEVGGAACEAQADPQRLRQALTNVIDNAIKFAKPGGAVRASAWARDGEVGVTVTDDGPGIPVADRAHIFDRFYRVDRARGRDAGGSGLGLAICREIASAHGGRVWVESEEGRGSAFSLALPADPP